MTVAEDLADWGMNLSLADVPLTVQHAVQRHLLDGVGVAIAAARRSAAEPALAVATTLGGPPEACILTDRRPLGAAAAALATGVLVHALDFDDTHAGGLVHATAVVLPAAFAVGQQVGASGEDIVTAALVGYEVVCRLGVASPYGFHARGLHATGVCGPLAAAMVAARLMRMNPRTAAQALGIAGSSAAGLMEFLDTGASTKQLHPGSASMSGVLAARLAAHGATGPVSVIEGRQGLYAAYSNRPADPRLVLDGLGTRWEADRITIKPYPACQLMHAALDAAAALRPRLPDLAEVTELVVDVHPDSAAVVCEPAEHKSRPRSVYDAKFSLPWSLAAMLIDEQVGVDTYTETSLRRAEVAALAERVRPVVTASPGVAADAPGRVAARLADRSWVEASVEGSTGGPSRPFTDRRLCTKFAAGAGGDGPVVDELTDRLLRLTEEPDLSRILHLAALSTGRPDL